jgi:hypothetical protein
MGQHKNLDENKANNQRKKKILFVNDDADTTAVMKVGLNRHGFDVDTYGPPRSWSGMRLWVMTQQEYDSIRQKNRK